MEPVLNDVRRERALQDKQWGGPEHDDEHLPDDWMEFIETQVAKYRADQSQFRERFVKIAALAVAAIESLDRQTLEYGDG